MTDSMSTEYANEIPYTIGLILFFSVTGTIGNTLVLFVYSRKNDKQTATVFIQVMAIADLINCLVNMPLTIVYEYSNFFIPNEFLCRFYFIANCFSTLFSSLLMSAIALDRYLCICHPFARLMTVWRAKLLVFGLATFSLILALFTLVATGVEQIEVGNSTKAQCVDKAYLTNFSMTTEQKIFMKVGQNAHIISYIICVVVVVFLYILIYFSVLRMRRKRRKLKGNRLQLVVNNGNTTTHREPQMVDDNASIVVLETNVVPRETLPIEEKPLRHCEAPAGDVRTIRDNQFLQNLKTAAMLFIVAYVYILGFVPAILMTRQVIELHLYIFYLYYINNAANPVIYSFMNKNFRQDIQQLCQKPGRRASVPSVGRYRRR